MGRTAIALALVFVGAVGCSGTANSPQDPTGWDDRATPSVVVSNRDVETGTRPLIQRIETLDVTATPGGVIVRATGIAPVQGHYDGELVPVRDAAPGIRAFTFRSVPPQSRTIASTPRSREVTVAEYLTNDQLVGIREIQVSAAQNVRALRR